ncbi:MAG: beta-ketoacyl-[acyl-carrier-protein] synthase II, partial [Proteobacteria bacterium]|nr:beta-ketoacyl-[acyl-carrier-protein] synthase II [Pseudomonadota bacterium]
MMQTSQLKPLLALSAYTLSTPMGLGNQANYQRLLQQKSSLRKNDLGGVDLDTWIGRVDRVESQQLPEGFADWTSRNNQLLELGLQQDGFIDACKNLLQRYGSERIGLFVGTSTSGIQAAEAAYAAVKPGSSGPDFNYRRTQNLYSASSYLRERLGIKGPGLTISTACSSSAKIFAAAHRHIVSGLCDAAIVVGVDSLCQMTLYGFNSLQLVSAQRCKPADMDRDGINVGEAMAAAILEPVTETPGLCLLGYGESSDAWHMSTPHPEGAGAARAMH